MKYELIFLEEAFNELYEARTWYDEQRIGLSDRFLICVNNALVTIAVTPEIYAVVYKKIRRVVVKHFPYSIFYIIEDMTVKIIAVFNDRRHPNEWKRRH